MKEQRIETITRTGVLIALLVAVQWITGFTRPFAGQYITGICVNCILVLAVLMSGLWSGVAVAILSPFCAFFLGLGPGLLQVIPAIAMGNCGLAVVCWVLLAREKITFWQKAAAVAAGSLVKFIVLYCAVIKVLVPVMGPALPAAQASALTAMFSWPQLVTALAGSGLAVLLLPVLRKAVRK